MDEAVTETEYEALLDIHDAVAKDAAPLNTAKVIKGEIHNVLNVMRADDRYASPLRFSEELPLDEHPLLRKFRDLNEKLSLWESAQEPMDVVAYLTPFCSAISERDISASVTGAALSSLHKFLLYGFITHDTTPHAMEGMTLVAKSLLHCAFEEESGSSRRLNRSTHSVNSMDSSRAFTWYDDEQVVLKLLYLAAMVVRSSLQQHAATPLLDTSIVVGLLGTCLHVSHRAKQASSLLKSAAADALGQIVLVVFHEAPLPNARSSVLSQLATFVNPQQYSDETCVNSLTLLNIAFETMQQAPTQAEITILQNDLCKHLLQLSTTHDLVILSLTLRVIFNLFQSIRNHLKVPLEVFLTSVHLRILDPSHNQESNEQREVALESLLEFCQEPALMQDLYLNYDCDVHCSNLFEMICATLGKMAVPKTESAPINVLNRLALEGILHVMDSIARRCQGTNSPSGVFGRSFSNLTDTDSETNSENLDSAFDDLGDRWKADEVLQERKRHKFVLSEVATEFNENSDWIRVAQDLELFARPATPESVARFLYTTPHLDKTVVGIYLSKGPAKDYPFHAQVRSSFCGLFDFKETTFAQALRKFVSRFRLPGEAQCIDRLMEAFADELYQQQLQGQQQEEVLELEPKHDGALFRNADAVFTLAFSTIILNTDLHNPNLRDDRRMTLEQFLRNNRGINSGDDFPVDFMTDLYTQIKEQEIQVRKELLDLIRRKMLNGDVEEIHAKHWAGILSKSSEVAEPFFTPIETARRNDIQAGIHDRAMFVSISKSVIECVSTVFVRSTDDALVVKALNGFQQMAKICIYFELDETFNEILQILLGHGRDYIMSCVALEYAGYDSNQIMAAGPSSPASPSHKRVGAAEKPHGPGPVPTILFTTSDESDPVDPHDVNGSAAHSGLLSLDAGFGLVRDQPSKIREAWPTLIECLCALRDARALPDRVIFLDDFADSHGKLLPLSPFAEQSQKRLDEYYRSLSDKEDKKEGTGWFQFSSLFNVHEDTKSKSSKTVTTQDETDGGDSIPEKELSSFSRSLLAITKRNRLEDVMLMRPTNMPTAKQTIRALLDAVDEYPYFDDPIFEQHAVYSLELALLALISNKDKVHEIYPMFLPKFETVLKDDERTTNSQASVHLPTPFLMERVVVTILRSCIHLYDYPEVRPDLRKALNLLLVLPPNLTRCISDRMSCGMAIFLSQKFPLFDSDEEWTFVGDMLDRLAHFGAGRGFVFDGIANAVESQLTPSSQKGDSKLELSYVGSRVLSKLLTRFIFGSYENDMSLVVPAMMCLENLYRHMVLMKCGTDSDNDDNDDDDNDDEEEEGSIDQNTLVEAIPDKDLWQNVAVAFYSVCRSTDPIISREGSDCFQRFVMSTEVESLPDEKWIAILFLIVAKQPPVAAHETRINSCSILCKVLLMTVGHLSKDKDNWEDLTNVITQMADVVRENLQEGRNGMVRPLFESTLQAVTFLSNHMVSSEFGGSDEYGQWASETLLTELEKFGAAGGVKRNIEATSKRTPPFSARGPTNGNHSSDIN